MEEDFIVVERAGMEIVSDRFNTLGIETFEYLRLLIRRVQAKVLLWHWNEIVSREDMYHGTQGRLWCVHCAVQNPRMRSSRITLCF